jgi:CHAT domain-containing protein
VVHLATHGEYEIALEGLVTRGQGGLQLADGELLDLASIDAMTLGRRPIVILSACETGRTDWRDLVGQGIADHFLAAGAAAVVATLWVVDDLSTALLMWRLHQLAQQGQDLATALRSAQLWLRALQSDDLRVLLDRAIFRQAMARSGRDPARILDTERPFAEPFHWAPFHLLTRATQPPGSDAS